MVIFSIISRYDSRKTPSDGIPETEITNNPNIKNKSGETKLSKISLNNYSTEKMESNISIEGSEPPPNRPNSGLGYQTKDENWCYNCDSKHEDKGNCPFINPVSVCVDSVIDFSVNDRDDDSR